MTDYERIYEIVDLAELLQSEADNKIYIDATDRTNDTSRTAVFVFDFDGDLKDVYIK